jgi:hypothetical protein
VSRCLLLGAALVAVLPMVTGCAKKSVVPASQKQVKQLKKDK